MSAPANQLKFDGGRRATRVRFLVVGVTALMAVLLYLDRFCISFAEVFIKEELRLSDAQVGWMLSAFFWTYALMQVPSGWMTDRFGARIMLTTYILLWSLFTGLTGLAFGFAVLLLLRLGFGIAQAGAYPTGASIISKWVPFSGRGRASSIVAVGGRIGGVAALYLTGILIVWFVPTSVSSRLEPGDLLNVQRLSYELMYSRTGSQAYADAESSESLERIARKIVPRLAEHTRTIVSDLAAAHRLALNEARQSAVQTGKPTDDLTPDLTALSDAQRTAVVSDLNNLLRRSDVFTIEDARELPLEKEAKRLLNDERGELTVEQIERLNRLVLEAAYPDSFRKVYGAGWRQVMWTYGLAGLLVAGLFWICLRDRPDQHRWVNHLEVELIEQGRPPSAAQLHGKVSGVPIVQLLKSGSMWMLCLSQCCTNVGWVFILTWAPRYFKDVHNTPVETRAWMVAIPPLVGWAGMLTGGYVTDRLVKAVGLRWGRALPMALSRFTAMAAYIYCLTNPSPWAAVLAFSVVAFSTDMGTASVWGFMQDVGGRYVGSILGWGNMWGNLGAALSPPLLIWIVNQSADHAFLAQISSWFGETAGKNWNLAFLACAVAFFIAGLACLGVNAAKPIAPTDEKLIEE